MHYAYVLLYYDYKIGGIREDFSLKKIFTSSENIIISKRFVKHITEAKRKNVTLSIRNNR